MRSARPLTGLARVTRWNVAGTRRRFADKPPTPKDTILSSDPSFKPVTPPPPGPVKTQVPLGPGGPGSAAPEKAAPTPATPSSSAPVTRQTAPIPPVTVNKVQTAPPTSTSTISPAAPPPIVKLPPPAGTTSRALAPAPPPPPPSAPPHTIIAPPPKRSRFRTLRYLFYLTLISILGYGGAVFFALRNDNFHDFFTEYVPFGEDAVLYFEERAFHKRFPNARQHSHRSSPSASSSGNTVTIPSKSGLSWRVSDDHREGGSDLTQKGKHMSAVDAPVPSKGDLKEAKQDPGGASGKEKSAAVQAVKKPGNQSPTKEAGTLTSGPASKEPNPEKKPELKTVAKKEAAPVSPVPPSPAAPSPKEDPRPPAIPPVTQLSPLTVPNADEPLVQDLTKIVNDLITVINADSADASNKYYAPITKAKDALSEVGHKILALKTAAQEAAEERVKQAHKEFDEGAKQLLQRIEAAQREDEARYQEQFEQERDKIGHNYETRLKSEIERSQQLSEQRLSNELAEQAIEMKRKFIDEIKSLVESERSGRLSQLSNLSTNVDNLTSLTSNWNGVIDTNLATQKLQVAVDAVRAALYPPPSLLPSNTNPLSIPDSDKPKPFVRELAALKLVADNDSLVDAAIASINPTAYQRGIPSPAQLVDRFRRVSSEVRKASLLPENAGVASHAASFVLSKVLFKKAGQPQGNDVESVLTRTESMLEEGDLDGAAREMNGLQGWAGVLAQDWLGDVRKVLEVRQALDVCEAEVRLRALRVS